MNLREQLMQRHDKQTMLCIKEYVGRDSERFARLMDLFFSGEYRIQQRASWAVMHCADACPSLVYPYLKAMLAELDQPVHDSVKRNVTRILRAITLPEELYGEVADKCFKLMMEPGSTVAVKVFSMYSLLKIVKKEPDLAAEFRLVIEENLPYASPAFKAAAAKVLKELKKR